MEGIDCPVCSRGGVLHAETVVEAKDHSGRTVVIRGIPAFVCDQCGTRVFDDGTARALETLYRQAEQEGAELVVLRFEPVRAAG